MIDLIHPLLRFGALAVAVFLLLPTVIRLQPVAGQNDEIAPGANLEVHGIPKVPASLAQKVRRYTNAFGLPIVGWDPAKREVWLKGISNSAWVSRIEAPGNFPKPWLNIQATGVYDLYFHPQAKHLVYNRDADGDSVVERRRANRLQFLASRWQRREPASGQSIRSEE